jgi:hypothetical protein
VILKTERLALCFYTTFKDYTCLLFCLPPSSLHRKACTLACAVADRAPWLANRKSEVLDTSTFSTAKTVEGSAIGVDRERRGFFVVKDTPHESVWFGETNTVPFERRQKATT